MPKPRPQPYYARLTQPPRSPNGRNRQAVATNHSNPLDGAGASAGGADAVTPGTWYTGVANLKPAAMLPGGITYIDSGVNPNLNLVQAMIDAQTAIINQVYGINIDILEPPPIPYTGIHSGELTGYRAWLVTDEYDLCSLAHYFIWEPKATIEGDINEMVWKSATGITPDRFGGVYAYSSFGHLRDDELINVAKNKHCFPYRVLGSGLLTKPIKMTDYMSNLVTYLGLAFGTVKLWGETIEHEKGYRASFAKLTSIDGFIGVDGFDLVRLKEKYLSSDGE